MFRRAHGLWADGDGNFFHGVFADSPSAVLMTPASFVGWLAGTEYEDDREFWATKALTDVESIAFMERDGFVLFGSAEGDAAFAAAEARLSGSGGVAAFKADEAEAAAEFLAEGLSS
jgi:hypothetical protein